MSDHPIVHIEISAIDRQTSSKFYAELFGWHIQQMPEMNYATFDTHSGVGGGFSPITENNPPGSVIVYIDTEDIDATLAKAEKLGGKVLVPKSEIAGMGWYAIFVDPGKNRVGLYTDMPKPES